MQIRITLCFIILAICENSYSQNPVTVKSQRNERGEIIFEATNTDYCDYFLTLNFNQISNTVVSSPVQVNVRPGTSQIFKLTPLRENEPIGYSYNSIPIRGRANPKIDESLPYLFPVKEGKITTAFQLMTKKEPPGKPVSTFIGLAFTMNAADTVYAARGGYVCKINIGNAGPAARASSTNSIEIFHADGTFGNYDLLKNDGILVELGTKVNAGDPIAIIDKVHPDIYVNFLVYYLESKKIKIEATGVTAEYSYFKPKFAFNGVVSDYISNTSYQVTKPENIITREMTKMEKEKFEESKKK